jgi:hypothetical protein
MKTYDIDSPGGEIAIVDCLDHLLNTVIWVLSRQAGGSSIVHGLKKLLAQVVTRKTSMNRP